MASHAPQEYQADQEEYRQIVSWYTRTGEALTTLPLKGLFLSLDKSPEHNIVNYTRFVYRCEKVT